MLLSSKLSTIARRVKLLVLDFDGILTPGILHIHSSGDVSKTVSYLDIVGLTRWRKFGHDLCIISGDGISSISRQFVDFFKIPKLLAGRMDKQAAFIEVANEYGIPIEDAIYMGDDVMDLPAMQVAGFGATVPTAHPYVLKQADWVSTCPAGAGAVRELIDLILCIQGYDIMELRPRPKDPDDNDSH